MEKAAEQPSSQADTIILTSEDNQADTIVLSSSDNDMEERDIWSPGYYTLGDYDYVDDDDEDVGGGILGPSFENVVWIRNSATQTDDLEQFAAENVLREQNRDPQPSTESVRPNQQTPSPSAENQIHEGRRHVRSHRCKCRRCHR
ncbi:uncharacterized protein LOC127291233 [Leptopilina boulardi]|uniref:uncharacterized protein LOC127291233 n=1 Tax=Leptopilina boulardi TaxID=63433 RepID=UPI0021F62684|nr:uncharacterized protein LOC127291233 [Leptopilina boulardi]